MSARTVAGALDELPEIDAANVVRCARVLLRRPLLHAGGPDGDLLPMIYRHRRALQEMFATLLGYRLVVERRFVRLHKLGPGHDATRGERSLGPRGYAYFTLALAALTGIGRQVLLSRLVTEVRAAAGEAGVEVSDAPPDRRALTAALRHLVGLGVISETEGSVTPWAQDSSAEALITIDTDLLGHLLSGPLADARGPEDLVSLAADPGVNAESGSAEVQRAVRRRLVENPVVHYADLPAKQAEWLRSEHNQARESRLLERCFGLVTEARLEGVAVTDPEEYLTDLSFPGTSTVARISLLALPRLLERGQPRSSDGRHPVSWARLREVCGELVEDHPAAWSRQATEDLDSLTADVVALLRRLMLLSTTDHTESTSDGELLLSPAAHRWAPEPDAEPGHSGAPAPAPAPAPASWSLFDELDGDPPTPGGPDDRSESPPAGSGDPREPDEQHDRDEEGPA